MAGVAGEGNTEGWVLWNTENAATKDAKPMNSRGQLGKKEGREVDMENLMGSSNLYHSPNYLYSYSFQDYISLFL